MGDWLKELPQAQQGATNPGKDSDTAQKMALRQVVLTRREAEVFMLRWPDPQAPEPMFPAVSWAQLERQLVDLADTPAKAAMARDLVSGTRKMAAFKPPEMVLREVLCLAWALLDESFQPEEGSGETP